jgi:hypothetical protein
VQPKQNSAVVHFVDDTATSFSTFTADPEFNVNNSYYFPPHTRVLPYLIGMMAGYYLWRMRGKKLDIHWVSRADPTSDMAKGGQEPGRSQCFFDTRSSTSYQFLLQTTNLVIWAAALSVGWMCVFGLYEIRSTNTFMKPSYSRDRINQAGAKT